MRHEANKRGQSISITTIIIAALALIVLIVLIAIFTGKLNIFTKGESSATDSVDQSLCARPGTGNYCAVNNACRTGADGSPEDPGAWIDCGSEGCCIPR